MAYSREVPLASSPWTRSTTTSSSRSRSPSWKADQRAAPSSRSSPARRSATSGRWTPVHRRGRASPAGARRRRRGGRRAAARPGAPGWPGGRPPVSPGKPAITSAPMAAPGRAPGHALDDAGVAGGAVRTPHRREHPVRPALQRQVEVLAEDGAGVLAEELDREAPSARSTRAGAGRTARAAAAARTRSARTGRGERSRPQRAQVHAGEHHLGAGDGRAAAIRARHSVERQRPGGAPGRPARRSRRSASSQPSWILSTGRAAPGPGPRATRPRTAPRAAPAATSASPASAPDRSRARTPGERAVVAPARPPPRPRAARRAARPPARRGTRPPRCGLPGAPARPAAPPAARSPRRRRSPSRW